MVLTELPMVIVVNLIQVEKASSPMVVTKSGIVKAPVSPWQS